jgi:hypothetical protein
MVMMHTRAMGQLREGTVLLYHVQVWRLILVIFKGPAISPRISLLCLEGGLKGF